MLSLTGITTYYNQIQHGFKSVLLKLFYSENFKDSARMRSGCLIFASQTRR